MKLKRLFCYKYFCFLFFLIFAGGVGFAEGILKPDDDINIVWTGGYPNYWEYCDDNGISTGNPVIWAPNDNSGRVEDRMILNTDGGKITLFLNNDLSWIANLYIYGENDCIIKLNGHKINLGNLYIGSTYADIDSSDAGKKGSVKIEGGDGGECTVNEYLYTSSEISNSELSKIVLDGVDLQIKTAWEAGDEKNVTLEILNNASIKNGIYDVTINGDVKEELRQDIANGGSTPETPDVQPYIWYGSYSSAWGDTENWSTGEIPLGGEEVTIETEAGGDDPVLSSEISLTSIVFNTSSTLTIASGGSLTIDPSKLFGDYSILIESGGAFISSAADNFTIENNFKSSSKGTIKTENSNCAITINTNFDGPINFDYVGDITLEANNEVKFGNVKANTFTNNGTATVNTKLTSGTVTNNGKLTINGDIEASSVEILSGTLSIDGNKLASGNVDAILISESATLISMNSFTIESNFDSSSTGTIKTENSNCAITINTNFDGPINFDCVGNITLEANNEVKFGTVKANTFTNKGTATVNTNLTTGTVTNNGPLTIKGEAETGNLKNNSIVTITDGNELLILKKIDNSNGNITGSVKFTGNNINPNSMHLGNDTSEYKNLTIDTHNEISFAGNPKINNLIVLNANGVTFTDSVTIYNVNDEAYSGDFTFYSANFSGSGQQLGTSNIEFKTSGTVTFGIDENSTTSFAKDLTHTKGKTVINGTFSADEKVLSLSETKINGSVTVKDIKTQTTTINGSVNAENAEFGDTIINKLAIVTVKDIKTQTTTINGSVSAESAEFGDTTINGIAKITGIIKSPKVIISDNGTLEISKNLDNVDSITVNGTLISHIEDDFKIESNFDSSSTGTIKTENSNCAITINTNFDGPINFVCKGNLIINEEKNVVCGNVDAKNVTNNGTFKSENLKVEDTFVNSNTGTATVNTKLTSETVTNNGTLTINGDIKATSVEILSGTLSIDGNKLASGNVTAILISESATLISTDGFTIGNNFDSSSNGTIQTINENSVVVVNTDFDGPINFDCKGNLIINEEKTVVSGTVNAKNVTNNGSFTSENLTVVETFENFNTGIATVNKKLTAKTVTNKGELGVNELIATELLNNIGLATVNTKLTSGTVTNKGELVVNELIATELLNNIGFATVNTKLTAKEINNDENATLNITKNAETIDCINFGLIIFDGAIETNELLIKGMLDNSKGIITGKVQLTGENILAEKGEMNLGKETSTYNPLTINTEKEFIFTGSPVINNLIVQKANGVTFTDSVTIYNVNDENYSNNFNFHGAQFKKVDENDSSNIEFKTSGTVTFETDENSTTTFEKDLTHTEGKTVIKGTFSADENDLCLGETEINGSVNVKDIKTQTTTINGAVNAENAEFGNTNLTGKLTSQKININSTLILDGQVNGNEINLSEIKLKASSLIKSDSDTGSLSIKGNVGVDESVSEDSKVNLTLDVNTKIESNAEKIDVKNGNLLVLKNFISNVSLEINSNVYLYGNDGMETVFGSTDGTDTISKIDINKKNLIISKKGKVNIKGLVSSNNFVLYSGNIELSGDISTSGDVILLGEKYSLKDNQTGIQNLYSYTENRPANWSKPSYLFETNIPDVTLENPNGTKLPDGTELNGFSGKVNVLSGKSITVGKNFYANGIELSGNGKWNLFIPDNSNAENSFCEAYNSTVLACQVECSDENLRGKNVSKIAALQCIDSGENENWVFEQSDFTKIARAYSVSDKVIRVEFNAPVRIQKKYNQQSQLRFSNSPDENHLFEAVYLNADCSQEAVLQGDYYIVSQNYTNEENQTVYYCYFKANSTWNTDATGKSAGNSEKSTDYEANHKDTNICLDFPRAIQNESAINSFVITDAWGTRLKNYSLRTKNGDTKIPYGHNDDLENSVEDKTGPVLISVKTGQENHTEYNSSKGAEGQHSYDAHNFIEFLYSEPVNFGSENIDVCDVWLKSDEKVENIQVTQKFGALQNEDITQSGQLKIAGLAKIQNGKIYTGSQGNVDKYVNALYRFDEYSLRYSIAGFTDKTQTVKDREGFEHKKWIGYIEEAEIPSGDVSMITEGKNSLVSDLKGNAQTLVKKELVVDSAENGVYGKWDISSPMFAPFNNNTIQVNPLYVEAIGNNNGFGSTLDRIEFHLFDNTVKLDSSDEAVWLTEIGWCKNDGSASLILPDSYCADVFGGSRTFAANVQNRTGGGIRYSSLENAVKAFKYTSDFDIEPSIKFDETENVYTTVNARLFTGSSDFFRPANKTDGLYFALSLADKTLDVKSTFKISYNDKEGFITDLAGNRLKSVTFSTIDRIPPSISVVLSPINQKDFYVVFLKKVTLKGMRLYDNEGAKIDVNESLLELLPQCFEFVQINEDGTYSKNSDLQIDTNIAAQEVNILNKDDYTMFKMSFINEVSFDDVKNLHCRIKNPQKYDYLMRDPITNIKDSSVTLIQDELGNYINMYETHVLSDVAINGINPLYGYNSSIRGENVKEDSENLNYIVRDWNEEQKNYGTFKHNEEIAIVCDVDFNSIEKNQFEQNVQLFFNNDSENKYLAEKFNSEIGGNLRVWFPNIMEKPFSFFSLNKNTNFESVISTRIDKNDISKGIKFDILKESVQKWKSGDQISFLFSYLNKDNSQYQVYPAPVFDTKTDKYKLSESEKYPLFALRLKDKNDITSLDLWSFKVKSVTEQRGGVSILNNVINATYGEKTIVKLNVPQAGNVDVMVMTLDGNIVTYLQHGAISAGEHYFTWNGKNNAGQNVARGLYFVRVIGPNLDETRKVMVVKD